MLKLLFQTNAGSVPAIARVVLGIFFLYQGSQLMLLWFGIHGLSRSIQLCSNQLGSPDVFSGVDRYPVFRRNFVDRGVAGAPRCAAHVRCLAMI